MFGSSLPVHPRTGLTAIGIVGGKPVWPILGGAPTATDTLQTRHDALSAELDQLLGVPLPEDRTAAIAANAEIQSKVEERLTVSERLRVVTEEEVRRAAAGAAQQKLGSLLGRDGQPVAKILSEPRTYDPAVRHSYFLDLARVTLGVGDGDGGVEAARSRIQRHSEELAVELPARENRRDELAREGNDRELRRAGYNRRARDNAFEKRVNPNRTDGQGVTSSRRHG